MITEDNNMVLTETVQEKDLRSWISNNLKFEQQVVAAFQQAMVVLRSVKRAFIQFERETFNIVYNTYIRPHLEYCVQAWSPYYAKSILMLEKVQRRATKMVIGFKEFTYENRLTRLKLYRLEHRDLIETFKLLTGKENINPGQFLKINLNNLRSHSKKLSYADANFSVRILDVWNSFPDNITKRLLNTCMRQGKVPEEWRTGTTDGMFALRQMVEKRLEMQGRMAVGFVDLEKAYDSP